LTALSETLAPAWGNYVHNNPVASGFVIDPVDYKFSSTFLKYLY